MDEETVKKYIESQERDEDDQRFTITASNEVWAGSEPAALPAPLAAMPTFSRTGFSRKLLATGPRALVRLFPATYLRARPVEDSLVVP